MAPKLRKDGTERKRYTLSAAALAQRRGAGRTHGKQTASLTGDGSGIALPELTDENANLEKTAPADGIKKTPVEPSSWCPECGAGGDDHLKGCSRSDQGATAAAFVEALLATPEPPAPLVIPTLPRSAVTVQRGAAGFAEALEQGRPEVLNPTMAEALETLAAIARKNSAALLAEGLAVDSVVMGAEGPMTYPVGAIGTDGRDLSGVVVVERKTNPLAGPTFKALEMIGATAQDQALTPKSSGEKRRDDSIGGIFAQMVAARERLGIQGRC